jgi:ATP-dependent 26S proteasome regulatory subunit
MTTNHKDNLDSVLLRSGHINIEIEFKWLRNVDIAGIYNRLYGYNISII